MGQALCLETLSSPFGKTSLCTRIPSPVCAPGSFSYASGRTEESEMLKRSTLYSCSGHPVWVLQTEVRSWGSTCKKVGKYFGLWPLLFKNCRIARDYSIFCEKTSSWRKVSQTGPEFSEIFLMRLRNLSLKCVPLTFNHLCLALWFFPCTDCTITPREMLCLVTRVVCHLCHVPHWCGAAVL